MLTQYYNMGWLRRKSVERRWGSREVAMVGEQDVPKFIPTSTLQMRFDDAQNST